jgi:hypothetical protein
MRSARSGIVDDIFDHPHAPWNTTRNRESSGEQRTTLHIGPLRSEAGTRFIPAEAEKERQISITKFEHGSKKKDRDEKKETERYVYTVNDKTKVRKGSSLNVHDDQDDVDEVS